MKELFTTLMRTSGSGSAKSTTRVCDSCAADAARWLDTFGFAVAGTFGNIPAPSPEELADPPTNPTTGTRSSSPSKTRAKTRAPIPPDGRRVLRNSRMTLHACLRAASRHPRTGYGSRADPTVEEHEAAPESAVEEARRAPVPEVLRVARKGYGP